MANSVHKGFFWSSIMQFANHGANIIITIILARLLSPNEFGLVAMILVLTEFSRVLLNFGFGQALIQKKEVSDIDYSSVFWLNIMIGTILSIILFFSATLVAGFYEENALIIMTKVLSINYVIAALGIVPQIILTKELDFKSLAQIRVSAVIITGVLGVLIAYNGGGVWALIFIQTFRTLLISVASFFFVKWKPQFLLEKQAIKDIFGFSVNLFGNEALNYWMDNLDKILIGKTLGDFSLGLYQQSYSFMMLPVNNVARVINSVLFPVLSKHQDNVQYLGNVFVKGIKQVMLIIFPILTILFVVSESFVGLLLGDEWLDMVIILRMFSIVGIFYTLAELTFSFFLAIGKPGTLFAVNSTIRVIVLIAIGIGVFFGIKGVAIGLLITSPIRFVGLFHVLTKKLPIMKGEVYQKLFLFLVLSFIVALLGMFIHEVILAKNSLVLKFILSVLVVSTSYFIFISFLLKKEYKFLISTIKNMINKA